MVESVLSRAVRVLLTGLAVAAAAVLMGLMIGVAGVWAALALGAGVLLWAMLLLSWPWMLALLLVMVYLVAGPLQYAAGIGKAFWIPYLMASLMGVRLLVDAAGVGAAPGRPGIGTSKGGPWIRASLVALLIWTLCVVLGGLLRGVPPMQWLVGGKDLYLLWALPGAFAAGLLRMEMLDRLWKAVAVWLWLQVPVVLWQRFVVAPRRGGDSPWDAVVGLFAGQAWGGGGSGTMAIVSLWGASLVTLAWRAGRAHGAWAASAVLAALLACAMAEVKIALLLVPLLAVVAAWPLPGDMSSRNGQGRISGPALAIVAAGVAFSAALLVVHQLQFASARSGEGRSLERYIGTMMERNLDDALTADEHGQLTRMGALRWWWTRQSASDVPGWLIGHGIGSSRRTQTSVGDVTRAQRFDVARSTASVMLWETGVLGLGSWVVALAAMAGAAWRLRREPPVQDWAWLLQGAAAILLLSLLSLPYGADLLSAPHLSVAVMLGIGIALGAQRLVASAHAHVPGTQAHVPGTQAHAAGAR